MTAGNEHSPLLIEEPEGSKRTPLRYALRFAGERRRGRKSREIKRKKTRGPPGTRIGVKHPPFLRDDGKERGGGGSPRFVFQKKYLRIRNAKTPGFRGLAGQPTAYRASAFQSSRGVGVAGVAQKTTTTRAGSRGEEKKIPTPPFIINLLEP